MTTETKRPTNPIVLIPARLASTRLPDKPLADIAGAPMIVQVYAARGRPMWAWWLSHAPNRPFLKRSAIQVAKVITDPDHPSGSDRIHEALGKVDSEGQFDAVVNLQGDLPTIDAATVRAVLDPFDVAAVTSPRWSRKSPMWQKRLIRTW